MARRAERSDLRATQAQYLEAIALVRRPNTVINSRTVINGFIAYIESAHPGLSSFRDLDRRHVEGWYRHLARKGLKTSTRRNAIIKLRVFLETLQDEGWEEAPRQLLFKRGDLPPLDRQLPRPLSTDIDRALREELARRPGLIPKAVLLLRATGLRSQELLDLRVSALSEIRPGDYSLRVPLGKLHSERVIPVDRETATLFAEIRELRSSSDPEAYLIARPDGRRYTREALRHALRAAEKRARLADHPTPHRLRHTYATELLRAGMRLPVLMKLLGHRDIGMTLRYAALSGVDVERAYAETMDVVKRRYELDSLRPKRRHNATSSRAPHTIVEQLENVARDVERFRRDQIAADRQPKIMRLLERLHRLTRELEAALS